ncbi:MAG: hypothetical protein JOZ54_20620 [Acidobacteria bacterium]|nr:hypothetical protein [Acidobacteriota bacterium]
MSQAARYVEEMSTPNGEDCVRHAERIASLLIADGLQPWIGRLRDVHLHEDTTFHAPLIPRRFPHLTWNTHYVACAGSTVYDPLAGAPLPLAEYAQTVFGREIVVERWLDEEATAEGNIRRRIAPS